MEREVDDGNILEESSGNVRIADTMYYIDFAITGQWKRPKK